MDTIGSSYTLNNLQVQNVGSVSPSTKQKVALNIEESRDAVSFSSKQKKQKLSFVDKIKTFLFPKKVEKTHYSSVNKGFEEHFYELKDSIISELTLTDKQKKILNKKIKQFEKYKAGLDSSQLFELEKNKHSLLDFSLKDGNPDLQLKSYNDFLFRYESFKSGDYTGITNEELSQLLYYTDTTDLISDGKIGSFAQGRTGDCWFLSLIGNYASTKAGEKNIANRISKPDKNGTYTVTFDDPFDSSKKKEYKVSQEDLKNYDLLDIDTYFSSGDLDVRILEVAMGKMLNENLLSLKEYQRYRDEEYIFNSFMPEKPLSEFSPSTISAAGFVEKQLLVHRSLGYESNIIRYVKKPEVLTDDDMLLMYSSRDFIENTDTKIFSIELELVKENGEVKIKPSVKATEYESLTDIINKKSMQAHEMVIGSGGEAFSTNKKENRYISGGHAFNIMDLHKDGSITVNDPYNSAFPHTITNEDFERVFQDITYYPNK